MLIFFLLGLHLEWVLIVDLLCGCWLLIFFLLIFFLLFLLQDLDLVDLVDWSSSCRSCWSCWSYWWLLIMLMIVDLVEDLFDLVDLIYDCWSYLWLLIFLMHSCNPSGGILIYTPATLAIFLMLFIKDFFILFWNYLILFRGILCSVSFCFDASGIELSLSSSSFLFSSLYFHTVHFLHPDITCQWFGVSACSAVRDFILIFFVRDLVDGGFSHLVFHPDLLSGISSWSSVYCQGFSYLVFHPDLLSRILIFGVSSWASVRDFNIWCFILIFCQGLLASPLPYKY